MWWGSKLISLLDGSRGSNTSKSVALTQVCLISFYCLPLILISRSLFFVFVSFVQMSWRALSSEHPSLKPVQLHRILTQYQLTAEIGPMPTWQPSSEDEAYIYRTGTWGNFYMSDFVWCTTQNLCLLWQHRVFTSTQCIQKCYFNNFYIVMS